MTGPGDLFAVLRRVVKRPFRGVSFYEWQIGPLVFQVRHTQLPANVGRWPLVAVWRDQLWRKG